MKDLDRFRGTIEQALRKWFEPMGYVVFDVNLREEPKHLTEEITAHSGVVTKLISSSLMLKRTTSWLRIGGGEGDTNGG